MSLDGRDPTDFEGVDILPPLPPGTRGQIRKDTRSNAVNGASAAGVRAFTAQAIAFYFRAPVKAFFRTRVDYLAYAKSINPDVQAGKLSWRTTTFGLLAHAVRRDGWSFIPNQLLPPLAANIVVGAALYTSYLQILGRLHDPSAHHQKIVYPPPPISATFTAGFAAGGIQSLIAAPLDALQVRFDRRGEDHIRKNENIWRYGREKLHEIGARGVFAGWGLSFLKDSFGSGLFFATFEYVKAQGYYKFVHWYYGSLGSGTIDLLAQKRPTTGASSHHTNQRTIKPHYALEPAFLMLAGASASVTQQTVLYPLTLIQTRHFERLEDLDQQAKRLAASSSTSPERGSGRATMLRAYYHAYQETWAQCKTEAKPFGSLRRWLYRGFWWSTIRQVPSTSAGLVIFELVRRKYGSNDEIRINQDGYDILLT